MVIDLQNALGRSTEISNIFFSSDGEEFYAMTSRFVHVFETRTGREKRRFKRNGFCSGCLPETNQMIFGTGPKFSICELETGKVVRQLTLKEGDGISLTDNVKHLLRNEFPGMIDNQYDRAVAPDGTKVVTREKNDGHLPLKNNLLLKNASDDKLIHDFKLDPMLERRAFAFSPDGKKLAIALDGTTIGFFNMEQFSKR